MLVKFICALLKEKENKVLTMILFSFSLYVFEVLE